mgnify:FL=1
MYILKKVVIGIISILAIIGIGIAIYMYFNNTVNSQSNNDINNNIEDNKKQENIINEINNTYVPNNTIRTLNSTPIESEISSFSTNLKGDSARLNNINITCNTINGTIIKSGDSFSFNSIVGQPTAEKGYQEADVFVNQKTEKGYGGGNCQVSTTIYNAVLKVEGIEVTERHPHKKKVSYIEEGKDAAVSYSGGLDLKFTNNTGSDIKLYVTCDNDSVDVKIVNLV